MGPWKFTMARPISAPYSSCRCRIESGDPSKPDRLARTTTGRLPLAALMARAGTGQVGRPVLGLTVRTHDTVVATDAKVVLGRDPAREVERLLAGQHHC